MSYQIRVYETTIDRAKIYVDPSFEHITDECRDSINAWLLEAFGIEKHRVYICEFGSRELLQFYGPIFKEITG